MTKEYPPETAWGGIATFSYALAPALVERGHEVHVLSCVQKQRPRDYVDNGVHVHRRGEAKRLVRLGTALRLSHTARRIQSGLTVVREISSIPAEFDIIHVFDWGAECWLLSLLKRPPSVVSLQGSLFSVPWSPSDPPPSFDARLAAKLEYFAVARSGRKVAPSELLLRRIRDQRQLENDEVDVIPNPVDPEWFLTWPRGDTEPTVLFTGRLESRKAPEVLVDALAEIRRVVPDARATLAGRSGGRREGKRYEDWLSESRDVSGCDFLGQVTRSELITIASRCRVLAMPSWTETFGIAAIEAMAAGMPVVVSSGTGVAEFVAEAGGGTVVPPGDAAALAAALLPFLADEEHAARVGAQARRVAENTFAPARVASLFEAAYKAVLEEVPASRRLVHSG